MYDQTYAQPPAQPAAGYAPLPSGPEPKRRHTGALLAVTAVVVLLLLAGGVALFGPFRTASSTEAAANGLPSSRTGAASTAAGDVPTSVEIPTSIEVPTPDAAPTTVAPAVPAGGQAPAGGQVPTGNVGNAGNGGGAPAPQAPPTPPAPTAPAPVITSFTTPENIDCHNGNFQMFTASWTTTNATKVTIAIDGPGIYKTYGPTGSDSLPFDCSTPHTFLLTAYGQDGTSVSRSITLQPRNVQVPSSDDDDASSAPGGQDDSI